MIDENRERKTMNTKLLKHGTGGAFCPKILLLNINI